MKEVKLWKRIHSWRCFVCSDSVINDLCKDAKFYHSENDINLIGICPEYRLSDIILNTVRDAPAPTVQPINEVLKWDRGLRVCVCEFKLCRIHRMYVAYISNSLGGYRCMITYYRDLHTCPFRPKSVKRRLWARKACS